MKCRYLLPTTLSVVLTGKAYLRELVFIAQHGIFANLWNLYLFTYIWFFSQVADSPRLSIGLVRVTR